MAGPRAVIAIATILLGATLAGCSEDDPLPRVEPSSPGSPSAATSLSPSPDPSPRPMSPEETVRAWVKARNQALQDGDISRVEQLSTDMCRTCANSIASIRGVYEKGGRFETRGWVVVASKVQAADKGLATVDSALKYLSGRTFPSASADPITYPVERHIAQFRLKYINGRWLVNFIGFMS